MEKDAERDRDQSNHNRHSRRSFLVGASDTDAVCNRKNSVKYRRCRDASWIDALGASLMFKKRLERSNLSLLPVC